MADRVADRVRDRAAGQETGLQVAVYHHGRLVVDAVAGTADPATGAPVTADTQPAGEGYRGRAVDRTCRCLSAVPVASPGAPVLALSEILTDVRVRVDQARAPR